MDSDRTKNGSGDPTAWESEELVLKCLKCGRHLGRASMKSEGRVQINCKKYECKVLNIFYLRFDGRSLQIANAQWEPKPIIARS